MIELGYDEECKYNVGYFNEYGTFRVYNLADSDEKTALAGIDAFNRRYRKPFPNGKGYYSGAQLVIRDPEGELIGDFGREYMIIAQ